MYKIGIVINENEVSHSKYADTLGIIKSALEECNQNGSKGNSYHFVVFDKFNIQKLFEAGEIHIMSFDGLVIATNALSYNEKIYNAFLKNKQSVEEFIDSNKGIFISSQKKLSNGGLSKKEFKSVGFLPELFDYYVFDRPEKFSSEGEVSVATENKIVSYPYKISDSIIKDRCENNQFMDHKYRSIIIPKHVNSYETLLCDKTSMSVSHEELGYIGGDRKVLLSSHYNKRVVISTMALDWANHAEILCNILTFITEDKPRTIFVKRENERAKNTIIDSYIIRANIANLPYRVIPEIELTQWAKAHGDTFIFSPNWQSAEIENIYASMLVKQSEYFTIYHIYKTNIESKNSHTLSKYSNFSSIDVMKDVVTENILGNYLYTSWNKSVWTYSYIFSLVSFFDIDIPIIVDKVYQELKTHFTKKEEATGKTELTGSYDNVFNATCKMLEILSCFEKKYSEITLHNSSYQLKEVIQQADKWIITKIETSLVFDQDICYSLLYLIKSNKYDSLKDTTKAKATQLLSQLLTSIIEEILSMRIENRSSVDLCRVHQTLCLLATRKVFPQEKTITYLDKIESILKERQDIYGNWKNISETSEITAMLLETYEARSNINIPVSTINILITKGVEVLYSEFNSRTNMWGDDLGTTAKAMYAIGMYDRVFNFAINDFFLDLRKNQEPKFEVVEDISIDRIGVFYQTIDTLEKEKESFNKKNLTAEKSVSTLSKKLSASKRLSLALFAALISLLFVVLLVFGILYLSYQETFFAIIGDWKSHLIAGFVGFVLSVILTVVFNSFGEKIRE